MTSSFSVRLGALVLAIALLAPGPATADGAAGLNTGPVTAEAERQIAAVRAAVARYRDFDTAVAEGWFPFGGEEPLVGQHFHHADTPDYTADTPIDFARPTNLMYADIDGEMVLTGVTFGVMLAEDEPLPAGFAGDADDWHVHDLDQIMDRVRLDRPILGWLGRLWLDHVHPGGRAGRTRRAMLHVWVTIENPNGPFALQNPALGYLKHGLQPGLAADYEDAVGRGLALAAPGGCERAYRPRLLVAKATRGQYRRIMNACEDAADVIRAEIGQGMDRLAPLAADTADRIANIYWITLDREQHDRVGVMADHGNAFCEPST